MKKKFVIEIEETEWIKLKKQITIEGLGKIINNAYQRGDFYEYGKKRV